MPSPKVDAARERLEAALAKGWEVELVATADLRLLLASHGRMREAARLKRNTIIHDNPAFEGVWVAVPVKDFDALRAALADPPDGEVEGG